MIVIQVICATVAFGLGVDLPRVTLVVHWDAATSVQMYVQQISRAGRRGDASLCLTMFDEGHLNKQSSVS
jgi:ATP-dependent DNA helicase RecQ